MFVTTTKYHLGTRVVQILSLFE